MADVERTFETYDIDVLGVTETGTPRKYSEILRSTVVLGLAKRGSASYTHLRAHETRHEIVCRLLLEKKKRLDIISYAIFCLRKKK